MDLADLKTSSLFLAHVLCVLITDARGLKTSPRVADTSAGEEPCSAFLLQPWLWRAPEALEQMTQSEAAGQQPLWEISDTPMVLCAHAGCALGRAQGHVVDHCLSLQRHGHRDNVLAKKHAPSTDPR